MRESYQTPIAVGTKRSSAEGQEIEFFTCPIDCRSRTRAETNPIQARWHEPSLKKKLRSDQTPAGLIPCFGPSYEGTSGEREAFDAKGGDTSRAHGCACPAEGRPKAGNQPGGSQQKKAGPKIGPAQNKFS